MQDVYKNIEKYNLGRNRKILIVFDMIGDMINYNKLHPVVTELFIKVLKVENLIFQFYLSYSDI